MLLVRKVLVLVGVLIGTTMTFVGAFGAVDFLRSLKAQDTADAGQMIANLVILAMISAVWILGMLILLGINTARTEKMFLGWLRSVIRPGQFYQLRGVVSETKCSVAVFTDRKGLVHACQMSPSHLGKFEVGKWYKAQWSLTEGIWLDEVKDEVAVGTLKKGHVPTWA